MESHCGREKSLSREFDEFYRFPAHLSINEKFWEERIAYFPSYDTVRIENAAFNNSSMVACVFVTAVTFLPTGA
jgi:hypothetical protein